MIVTLELAPGSAINERDLMERTGLGRTPIREALRTLANERLVEIFPRRGVLVAGVNAGDLAGLSEVRRLLEPPAARAAAERRTAADRAATEQLLAELAEADGDERSLIDLDQRIHRHVYRCTHNPFLVAALGEHYLLSLRIWFLALDRVETARRRRARAPRAARGDPRRRRRPRPRPPCCATSTASSRPSASSSDPTPHTEEPTEP